MCEPTEVWSRFGERKKKSWEALLLLHPRSCPSKAVLQVKPVTEVLPAL